MKKKSLVLIICCLLILSCSVFSELVGGNNGSSEILRFLPKDLLRADFTDWDKTKEYLGAEGTHLNSSEDEIMDFMMEVGKTVPVFAFSHRENFYFFLKDGDPFWKGNVLDFEWELNLMGSDGPPVYVYKFNESYDIEELVSLFKDEGFNEHEEDGIMFFSNELNIEYLRSYIMPEMALIEEERVIITSSSEDAVEWVVDTYINPGISLLEDQDMYDVFRDLPELSTFSLNRDDCISSKTLLQSGANDNIEQLLEVIYEPLNNYPLTYNDLLLVYSQNEEREPIYQYYLVYDDVETAQEDLETRQILLAEGESLNLRVPYAEIFSETEVDQKDNIIIITVDFPEDIPGGHRFMSLLFSRDLLFVMCEE